MIGDAGINISDLTNKSKENYAYSLIDLEEPATEEMVRALEAIDGVLKVACGEIKAEERGLRQN